MRGRSGWSRGRPGGRPDRAAGCRPDGTHAVRCRSHGDRRPRAHGILLASPQRRTPP